MGKALDQLEKLLQPEVMRALGKQAKSLADQLMARAEEHCSPEHAVASHNWGGVAFMLEIVAKALDTPEAKE